MYVYILQVHAFIFLYIRCKHTVFLDSYYNFRNFIRFRYFRFYNVKLKTIKYKSKQARICLLIIPIDFRSGIHLYTNI